MKIAELTGFGGPEVFALSQRPEPNPGPNEVVITVAGAGVNRADVLQRRGLYPPPPGWPNWPGLECSGIVSAIGDDVTGVELGDEVCALLGGGGYASSVVVPRELILSAPAGVDLVHAGGLMEAACTVWTALDAADAKAGQVLVVHGGSGGIGTMAIQVAKALGMTVLATAGSAERRDACLHLGAGVAIDYTTDDFVGAAADFGGADVIFDVVGAAYLERNLAALAEKGTLVCIGLQKGATAQLDLGALMAKRARIVGTTLRSRSPEDKARVVAGVGATIWPLIPEQVRPVIDSVYSLDDVAKAHERMESGSHFGKIVLAPGLRGPA